ncbi:hypothetical protein OC835_005931 [Tilletia horrida]|nr:hypothetical protein OC835_005931 [Tilletia horrida]
MSSKWDQPAGGRPSGGGSELSEAAQAAAAAAARIAAQFGSQAAGGSASRPAAGAGEASRSSQADQHEAPFQDKIEINDQRNRYMLTKGQTQQQIHKDTGASVTTKGQWYPDKTLATADEPPLYLHVTGTTQEMVTAAVTKIHELMEQELPQLIEDRHAKRLEWEAQRPPPREQRERRRWPEEKVPINLVPLRNFNVRAKIVGPAGLFVKFIQQETGAKVQIKGQGSGFIEFETQRESEEPMHIHLACSDEDALKEAKRLAEDLVDAVKTEHGKAEAVLQQQQQMYGGAYPAAQGYGPAGGTGGMGRPGYAQNGYQQSGYQAGQAGGHYQQQPASATSNAYGAQAAAAVQSPTRSQGSALAASSATPAAATATANKEEEDAVDKYWKDYVTWEKTFRNYHGRAPTKDEGGQTIPTQYTHLLN